MVRRKTKGTMWMGTVQRKEIEARGVQEERERDRERRTGGRGRGMWPMRCFLDGEKLGVKTNHRKMKLIGGEVER